MSAEKISQKKAFDFLTGFISIPYLLQLEEKFRGQDINNPYLSLINNCNEVAVLLGEPLKQQWVERWEQLNNLAYSNPDVFCLIVDKAMEVDSLLSQDIENITFKKIKDVGVKSILGLMKLIENPLAVKQFSKLPPEGISFDRLLEIAKLPVLNEEVLYHPLDKCFFGHVINGGDWVLLPWHRAMIKYLHNCPADITLARAISNLDKIYFDDVLLELINAQERGVNLGLSPTQVYLRKFGPEELREIEAGVEYKYVMPEAYAELCRRDAFTEGAASGFFVQRFEKGGADIGQHIAGFLGEDGPALARTTRAAWSTARANSATYSQKILERRQSGDDLERKS